MKFIKCLFFLLYGFITAAQQQTLQSILESYEAFNYAEVIQKSEQALKAKEIFTPDELIKLYLIKGISHFSISEEKSTQFCFVEILKLNIDYLPDQEIVSPKIISLFNKTKDDFIKFNAKQTVEKNISADTLSNTEIKNPDLNTEVFKNTIAKSLIFPGWGHLSLNQNPKGWILSSLTLISLSTMVYFIIDTNKKEKSYLNETDEGLIRERYDAYNTAYKIRNLSILLLSSVWTYSQIDLLLMQDNNSQKITSGFVNYFPPAEIKINWQVFF